MKKHFLLLGKAGLIYYCWLFSLLFLSFIFFYEKSTKVSVTELILLAFFFAILIYGQINSYWNQEQRILKLPYARKLRTKAQARRLYYWHGLGIWTIKPELQRYYFMTITKKRH